MGNDKTNLNIKKNIMKKLKITLLSVTLFIGYYAHAQITDPIPYCSGQYDDGGSPPFDVPHYISNVTIGTLNNFSGDTQYAFPHYIYYNTLPAPDLIKGNSYTLSVMHDPDTNTIDGTPNTAHWVAAYIDFNHNDVFDSEELVLAQIPSLTVHLTNPTVAMVTMPYSAVAGITRMRVMITEDDGTPLPTPCTANASGYMDWGETVDYNVNIVSSTSSVAVITHPNNLEIYPDPATNYIHINNKFIGADMSIIDIQGKLVKKEQIMNDQVDVSTLQPGQYIIKVTGADDVYAQQLLIGEK